MCLFILIQFSLMLLKAVLHCATSSAPCLALQVAEEVRLKDPGNEVVHHFVSLCVRATSKTCEL